MVPDDRSSLGGSQSGFDFNSQTGVIAVLAAIRTSPLSSAERNELKDMVFLYSNGGKDAGVRAQLEQRLAAHGILPSPVSSPTGNPQINTAPRPVSGFASGRPAPMFSAPTPTPLPLPVQQSVPVVAAPPVAEVPVTPVVPVAVPPEVPPQVVVVPVPTTPPVMVVPAVAMPADSPVSTPSVVPSTIVDPAARLERIKKIKSDINERVGNPVNLVDIDNVLGREYMAALLDAMKLLSTATEVESNAAMTRLELVYVQVMSKLQALESGPMVASSPISTPTPVTETITPVVPSSVVRTVPVQSEGYTSAPVTVVTPVPVSVATPFSTIPPPANLEPVLTPEQIKAAEAAWASSSSEMAPLPDPTLSAQAPVVAEVVPSGVAPLQSVAATAAPLRTPADLPSADSLQGSSVTGDPRYTKEVDEGLNQLLSEWSLFKKSGLFGTGPHGKEHPLFLKIANLQIPVLLSGRFEGSTQEIKQSITDYMNGWRYEQGIIYDQGETFEQYLRRVIRHIIDLQNKRRAS